VKNIPKKKKTKPKEAPKANCPFSPYGEHEFRIMQKDMGGIYFYCKWCLTVVSQGVTPRSEAK